MCNGEFEDSYCSHHYDRLQKTVRNAKILAVLYIFLAAMFFYVTFSFNDEHLLVSLSVIGLWVLAISLTMVADALNAG